MDFLLALVINALLIKFAFPTMKDFRFTGGFGYALLYALGLELMGILLAFLIAFFVIGTLGLGLIALMPFLLLGGLINWVLYTVQLKMLAGMFPSRLTINGWLPAIIAGLVLAIVDTAICGGGSHISLSINQ